ncbi:MAG: helix-turn-helix domain-containing protein [Nitrososphaerota archaeon]
MPDAVDELAIMIAGELAISPNPGKAMKTWRERAEIGQAQLAREMRISPSVLSDYENGRRKSPGTGFLKRFVHALLVLDREHGRLLQKKPDDQREQAILSIGEYLEPIKAQKVVDALGCQILTGEDQLERYLYGFTVLDSIRTIYALSGTEFYKIFGATTERVIVFTKVGLGRSPMVAVRVSQLKPRMVVVHGIKEVDPLAVELAKQERIILGTSLHQEGKIPETLAALSNIWINY